MTKSTEVKSSNVAQQGKIDSETVTKIMSEIDHDQSILNVARALLKEVLTDAIDLENKKDNPSLEAVIDHINGQEWSELFAESAQRTTVLIKQHLSK
ncbi:MAG: hypothetical protein WBM99_09565 [Psychromonas sp.]